PRLMDLAGSDADLFVRKAALEALAGLKDARADSLLDAVSRGPNRFPVSAAASGVRNAAVDPQQYLAAVERSEEMAQLQAQARRRKSLLIFGPEAVGKTRLLESF